MGKKNIFDTIKHSNNLPQLPQVMVKLIKVFNSNKTNLEELTQIISIDPALTSRIIQIIGSPYINLPKQVHNIKTAVVYLGRDTIRNIAISTSAMHFFKITKSIPEFNINRFWYHSYKCGVLARKLAIECNLPDPEDFFLAGLLHDIGRLVLLGNFPDEYKQILKTHSNESGLLAAEQEEFDTNTSQVSAWLFKQWDLNPLITDAVLFINESVDQIAGALPQVKILYIANLLAKQDAVEDFSDIISLVNIHESQLEQIIETAEAEVLDMSKTLGLNIENIDNVDNAENKESEEIIKSKIKDISLFFGTSQNLLNAKNIDSVFTIVQNGFKIIFNVHRVFYFMIDEKQKFLTGFSHKNDKSHNIIKKIALPVSNQLSLIVKSAKEHKVYNTLDQNSDQKLAISDIQLARLLETKGLYCIPLFSSKQTFGVMVLGIEDATAQILEENSELVGLFSKQTSVCIQNIKFHSDYADNIHEKKMQAYSTLTDKIIHEVNNPIAIIKNYIATLGLKLPDRHPAQEDLVVINEEMSRVAGLLDNMRNFSNPTIRGFEFVDINMLCTRILEILEKSILLPRQIKASIKIDPEIPRIKTDQNGIKQIFINLVKNAAEALHSDNTSTGEIRVVTRFVSNSEKILIDEKKKIPGNVEIEISDNGSGIDEKLQETLFEPYTTTKDNSSNSGLGLSIVHSIVKELNGKIICKTKPGQGTSFIITLPVNSPKQN